MSKKKVTAPLTYNPGKGRPKEHLAYLNYQEMQALKRLNGNNQERGPRGLPSFPPAGAMSGGSAKSPASTSKAAGAGSRPSSGRPSGGMMGGTGSGGSVRTSPSSGSGVGGGGGGGGGFKPGPSVGPKAPSFGGGGGSGVTSSANRGASPGSIGRSDRAAISAVNSANTKTALKTPAISADRPRTLNVGPMGTPVNVKTGQAGSQIKGAIRSVAEQAKKPTTPARESGPIPSNISKEEYGWSATGPSRLSAHQGMGIYGGKLVSQGEQLTQKEIDTLLNVNTSYDQSLNKQVRALSPEMRRNAAILSSAATLQGLDPRIAIGMGAIESGLGKNIGKQNARYQGLAQMGPGEFSTYADDVSKSLGRRNPWASAQSGVAYMTENQKRFSEKYGRNPSLGDVYGMHQQGFSGYTKLIDNPDKLARNVVKPSHVKNNLPKSMKGQWKTMTAGEFANVIGGYPERSLTRLSGVPYNQNVGEAVVNVTPTSSGETGKFNLKSLVPDAVKIGVAKNYAKEIGKDLAGYYKQGIEGLRGYFGTDAEPPSEAVKTGSKMVNLEPGDIYGPKYVSPEVQKRLERDEAINKVGVNIIKFRNPLASLADAGSKIFTGKGIADSSADLKRAYMQATDEQKAVLEDKYPNLTKFASDAGLTPKRDMSNYTNWAEKSGLLGTPSREGGRDNYGIASLVEKPKGDETTTPTPDTPSSTPGRRPDIYYMWDLGVNIPSPGDPNYTQYQTYLAERLSARQAVG